MPNKRDATAALLEEICEAIKALTEHRATRNHAAQWIMVRDVEEHIGRKGVDLQRAILLGVETHRLKFAGSPSHSISLIYGWDEA